ncbi:MAG TPA: hypothetical protein ENH07_05815 [Nitrospirae bacterium]|nr:hypothetical protein [Nitrospirota bacterium]
MKKNMANRLSFICAGAGIALFAVFGLLPGSFIGGVLGLNMAGVMFGTPVAASVLSRIVVAIGMLTGVMVTGLMFLVGGATLGWLIGTIIDVLTGDVKEEAREINSGHKNL